MSNIKSDKARYHLLELMYFDRMIPNPQQVVFLSVAENAVEFAEQEAEERFFTALNAIFDKYDIPHFEEVKEAILKNQDNES